MRQATSLSESTGATSSTDADPSTGKLNGVAGLLGGPVHLACVGPLDELDRGRACYRQRAWLDAHTALSRADQAAGLAGPDLELLAMSGFLVGRDHEAVRVLERAHQVHLQTSDPVGAARCAIWAGFGLLCLASANPWESAKGFFQEWFRHAAVWGEHLWRLAEPSLAPYFTGF